MDKKVKKLASEIVNVLKFNANLSDADKALAVECRLINLVSEIEHACAEARKRTEDNAVILDTRPQDIPELANLLIAAQQHRGPAN